MLRKAGYIATILIGIFLILNAFLNLNSDPNQIKAVNIIFYILLAIAYLISLLSPYNYNPDFFPNQNFLPWSLPIIDILGLVIILGLISIIGGILGLKHKFIGCLLSYINISIVMLGSLLSKHYLVTVILIIPAILIFLDRKTFLED